MAKKYLDINVYEMAMKRVEYLFNEFDNILVAFSGGKDSTVCLNLCYDYAKSHGMLHKLSMYHLDYEAQYQMTTDFVTETFAKFSDIGRYWLCVPMKAQCCCSMSNGYWIPWEKSKKDIWVRPMPTFDYVINQDNAEFDYSDSDYVVQDNFCEWFTSKHSGKSAIVIGIRADESLNRFRAIVIDKNKKYKDIYWINSNKAYPIYDWQVEDIWTYNAKYSKSYNHLYDLYYQAGLNISQMRVASPFNDCANATLKLYKIIDPQNWGKMVGRVNGVNFVGLYGDTMAMGWKNITKPNNFTWKQYCDFLLSTMDEKTRNHYLEKLNTSIKFWKDKGGALSDDTISELNGVGKVGKPNNYSDKRTVRFEEYPDDLEVTNFSEVPSYKRMCVCIIKNDYYCKYMGFARTKGEIERRKEAIKKYANL